MSNSSKVIVNVKVLCHRQTRQKTRGPWWP